MESRPVFPHDVTELLRAKLEESQRPPDGLLHPSGAMTGSLRHLQLEMAGAPELPRDLVSEVNLEVGTAVHELFETLFKGLAVMTEVKLDAWMPGGWSGTADWVAWDPERRCFILGDLKTCKPGGIIWIHKGGAKESHIWQVSVYWHALRRMGLPLLNGAVVYYLPKSQLLLREGSPVAPTMQEITPLPWDVVEARMTERKRAVDAYLDSIRAEVGPDRSHASLTASEFLTDKLAPVQEREVRLSLNKKLKRPLIDVKLQPNWSTEFCSFPDELCNCRQQGTNKIGSWDRDEAGRLVYTPSPKASQPAAEIIEPDSALIAALVKAQREASDGSTKSGS